MVSYWLDLFTGTTWQEFRDAGASVSGFRKRRRKSVQSIKQGDILLCYLTGVMRWVGALEVIGPSKDTSDIWSIDEFPERLAVRPLIILDPEYGVLMEELEGKVDFYKDGSDRGYYKGFLRGSPVQFKKNSDGELILSLLQNAKEAPTFHPVDPKKMARIPLYRASDKGKKKQATTLVSIPEEEEPQPKAEIKPEEVSQHVEIQYLLLKLGSEMGLDIWVARNDRSKVCNGQMLGGLSGMVEELPTQFNDATQKTIELIDVLWLKGNSILSAFEVESTTSIYSGLLRMSDLLSLQPNLDIKLYLLAGDERRDKVRKEILRPTFELKTKPLSKVCGYISFNDIKNKIEGIQKLGIASSLKPDFLEDMAEYFSTEED